ncbi:MAG: hemin uptake protein HemP [Accumulibacter sp.]|jgi:hemin uptake protein HemP|uniref:hemin uptake protein HemP n=1 Tax=Accumulibacter sp. TaxID=2053492 RepID=UPI002FC3C40F
MTTEPATTPTPDSPHLPTQPDLPSSLNSSQILRGQKTVEIAHGGQRYTLRVTKDNKLILTK